MRRCQNVHTDKTSSQTAMSLDITTWTVSVWTTRPNDLAGITPGCNEDTGKESQCFYAVLFIVLSCFYIPPITGNLKQDIRKLRFAVHQTMGKIL